MSDKNYLKIIGAKLGFLTRYFRVFVFLFIIAYLFYLAALTINVFSVLEYEPTPGEAKIKFSPIKAKNEVINSIESYFSAKRDNLEENLSKTQEHNPFLPYKKENPDKSKNVSEPEIKSID